MPVDDNQDFDLEDENIVVDDEDELDEATDAANTLAPGPQDPEWSRANILNKLMAYAAGLAPQDLTHFFHQSIAQIGHEADNVPDGAKATNQASISAKPSYAVGNAVREDVTELFADQENLSEELVAEAATLFEAAVQARVTLEAARIEEEMEAKMESEIRETVQELSENVSDYMDYVAEKWLEENTLAVENGFRAEATDQFIWGLRNLFSENFIDVPEEKVAVIDEMAEVIEDLQGQLQESINENVELHQALQGNEKEQLIADVTEGLTATDSVKLKSLTENLEFDDPETFKQKLVIVREKYFPGSEEHRSSSLLNEEDALMVEEGEEQEKPVPEAMKGYVTALARTTKHERQAG